METLKIVQIPEETRRNGTLSFGYGEARIYNARFRNQANAQLSQVIRKPGQVIPAILDFNGRSAVLDSEYQYLAFLPARTKIMEMVYDEYTFLHAFTQLMERLQGKDIQVVCSTPGAFENPDEETREARWQVIQDIADEFGVTLTHRFAPADLPRQTVDVTEDVDVKMDAQTLLVTGQRDLESTSENRINTLRAVADELLDEHKPSRVVTPLAVGISLAIAERAVARGIPVTFVAWNSVEDWVDVTRQRLEAVMTHEDLVTITGKSQYQMGRIVATVQHLEELAQEFGAKVITLHDGTRSEVQIMKNAVNAYPIFQKALRRLDSSAALLRNQPRAVPAVAGLDDLPF